MKRCFTSLTALLCSAAILLCSLPMQALAVEFRMQTAYEDVLPDELTAQKEAPAAPAEPEAPEAEKQLEAPPEGPAVSVLSTDNRSGDFTYSVLSNDTAREAACFRRGRQPLQAPSTDILRRESPARPQDRRRRAAYLSCVRRRRRSARRVP